MINRWSKRKQELEEEKRRLDEWSERLDKKGAIIEKLKVLTAILPDSPRAEEVIKDLDTLLERYQK